MENYKHNTNATIDKIETKFYTDIQKKYDLPFLHDLYEENRHRFFTAEEMYSLMQKEKYRYNRIINVLSLAEFTEWYNEMLRLNPTALEIGTHATVYYYSDSRAATVTSIEYYKDKRTDAAGNMIPKRIGVNLNDDVVCKDYYAADYEVHPITDLEQMKLVKYYFTLRRNHKWVSEGNQIHDGLVLGIGYWHHHIDPNF